MNPRHAYTLLELVVSLVSSAVLVAGLSGSLFIASKSLQSADSSTCQVSTAGRILHDLNRDLNQALSITERTANAISLLVPDRNGDSSAEAIRYAWSGVAGAPLTVQYNGGAVEPLANDVQGFSLTALTRAMSATPILTADNVVTYEGFSESVRSSNSNNITIGKPTGTVEGDLMIACVATDGNAVNSLAAPAGWNLIFRGPAAISSPAQSFGVWWKMATASGSNSFQFSWTPSETAYGWIMRFSGQDPTNPIHTFATQEGPPFFSAPCPAVTTTVQCAMILRLGSFDRDQVTIDSPGLTGNMAITMDRSSTGTDSCSGGAGYLTQASTGDSGALAFSLTSLEEYTTVTIAIAPDPAGTTP